MLVCVYTLVGVRVSSLSKKDNEKKTLDFYAHSSFENDQKKLHLFPITDNATNDGLTVSLDDTEDSDSLTCPICNKPVCNDNELLNSHIDICLNQQVIEVENTTQSTSRKHKR